MNSSVYIVENPMTDELRNKDLLEYCSVHLWSVIFNELIIVSSSANYSRFFLPYLCVTWLPNSLVVSYFMEIRPVRVL